MTVMVFVPSVTVFVRPGLEFLLLEQTRNEPAPTIRCEINRRAEGNRRGGKVKRRLDAGGFFDD